MSLRRITRTTAFCSLIIFPATCSAIGTLSTLALTGEAAPGAEGETFQSFGLPVINESNTVAFYGRLQSFDAENAGLWTGNVDSGLNLLARRSAAAPDNAAGVMYDAFPDATRTINSAGGSSFRSGLAGAGAFVDGLFKGASDGSVVKVAQVGEPAPDTEAGTVFASLSTSFQPPVFNDLGQVAFHSGVTGPSVTGATNQGIWMEDTSGVLSKVARRGDSATSLGNDLIFGAMDPPVLNSQGMIAFSTSLFEAATPGIDRSAVVKGTGGSDLTTVAQFGDPAPGAGLGVEFGSFGGFAGASTPSINQLGQLAFIAALRNDQNTLPADANTGVWAEGDGGLRMVAREGDSAAGLPGVDYGEFALFFAGQGRVRPLINDAGAVVFGGWLAGDGLTVDNNTAMFIDLPGSGTHLIARQGDLAPGTSGDTRFGAFLGSTNPILNNRGEVLFGRTLTGADVTVNNDFGIWVRDTSGGVHLVVREGDQIDVDDGPGKDLRTIRNLTHFTSNNLSEGSNNRDGRGSPFNDAGFFTFAAQFSDNTFGVFVVDVFRIASDFDEDGDGDGVDLLAWQRGFGIPSGATTADGDADGDGDVDEDDLDVWERHFGRRNPTQVAALAARIPEPLAALLAGMAVAGAAFKRNR
jgi:hypothetical protein